MEAYKYEPIDSSKSQIRLLTVNFDIDQAIGRQKVKPLSGSLTSHFLPLSSLSKRQRLLLSARLPMFYAISYVWGDPTRTREILIHGKTLPITENLYQAIRGMQREIVSSFKIWADAICINQEDLEERSGQILLMRDLYHCGHEVRIWLGQATPESLRVVKFINHLTDACVTFPDELKREDDVMDEIATRALVVPAEGIRQSLFRVSRVVVDLGDIVNPEFRDDRAKLLLDPDENLSLHQEFIKSVAKWRPSESRLRKVAYEGDFTEVVKLSEEVFIQNEWFTRMWVVQELGAGDSVSIQIGPIAINWEKVVRALYYLHSTRMARFKNIRRMTGMEKIRLGWIRGDRQPLRELIRECQYRKATDPRDKIYSLFGMMGDKMNNFLKPDYTKSIGEVYANATRHFISQAESLDVICTWQVLGRSTGSGWDLPSWAPDYSLDQQRTASPLAPTDGRESLFAASGADNRSKISLPINGPQGDWRFLPVKGIIIDTIDVLSSPGREDQRFGKREKDWLSAILSLVNLSVEERQALALISETVQKYYRFLYDSTKVDESNHSEKAELFVESIQNSPILTGYIYTLLCGRIASRERLQTDDINALLTLKDFSSSVPESFAHKASQALDDGIRLRRLAVTTNGDVGAAPYLAEKGDIICVIYGCSVPVVLRPSSEDRSTNNYQFIGECYLHRFMDAEAIVWHIKGKLEEEDFVLI